MRVYLKISTKSNNEDHESLFFSWHPELMSFRGFERPWHFMQKENFLLIVADHGRKEFCNECLVKKQN